MIAALSLTFFSFATCPAQTASSPEDVKIRNFDIPAAEAAAALNQFALQSGEQLLFSVDEVQGVKTNLVRGEMPVRAALDRMLAGTTLSATRDEKTGALAVGRTATPRTSGESPALDGDASSRREDATAGRVATGPQSDESMDEVILLTDFVVSGTIAPKRPMDSAASITTIHSTDIRLSAPIGAPDLIKQVPGFYVEAAGGEARSNVRARGLPSSGGYFYVGLQEDGLPALEDAGIFPDVYVRANSFVSRVEAIRGGASGVFQNNAPGGIVNFITREGSPAHHGELFFQTTSYNQLRGELSQSGPLSKNTTYAAYVGYSRDDGQKDTDIIANHGGQISGNVKHVLPDGRGSVKVSAKWLDQSNVLFIQIPLKNASNPMTIPGGPDIKDGTLFSADLRHPVSLPNTPQGAMHADVQNDSHVKMGMITGDLDLKLRADWKLKALSRFTHADYENATPIVTSLATPFQTLANSIATAAGPQFAAARDATTGDYNFQLSYPGEDGRVVDATNLNGNGLGVLQAIAMGRSRYKNFQTDLRLLRTIADRGAIAGGVYLSTLDISSYGWSHTIVNDISPSAHRVDFEYFDSAGSSLGFGTYNGLRLASTAAAYRRHTTSGFNYAPYLSVEHTLGRWTLEAGVRHETKAQRVSSESPATYNLNAPGENNPAVRNAGFGSGNWIDHRYERSATVWTAAANYKFNPHLSAYARMMNGYRMPLNDSFVNANYNGTFNPGPTERIVQIETGIKYDTRKLAIYASAIHSTLNNQLFIGNFAQPDGSLVTTSYIRSTDADSLEVEAFYTPIEPLTIHVAGTLQRVRYSSDILVSGTALGSVRTVNLKGKRAFQVPEIYSTVNATYRFPETRMGKLSARVDWEYIGRRAGDDANFTWLPSFSQFNAGLSLASGRMTYNVQVKNVFDTLGFTAYDPRSTRIIGDPTAAYLNARTYFPRSFLASISYSF